MKPPKPLKPRTVTLNEAQRLYVIACGAGYSCLGFDVLETRCKALEAELVAYGYVVPTPAAIGTVPRYEQYQAAVQFAAQLNQRTGWRSQSELRKELIGLEGKRLAVEHTLHGNAETATFILGKSTGFIPCHLFLESRKADGGEALYLGQITKVTVLKG